MACPQEFSTYTIEKKAQRKSQEFFRKNAAPSWSFENYLHYNSQLGDEISRKRLKKILVSYMDDLFWITKKAGVPKDLRRYVGLLRKKKYCTKELKKAFNLRSSQHRPINIKNNSGTINMATDDAVQYVTYNLASPNEEDSNKHVDEDSDEDSDEESESGENIWMNWEKFLLLAKNDATIHKYSPAKHNIICCGKDVSPRPSFPRDIFNLYRVQKFKEEKTYTFSEELCSYIDLALDSKTIHAFKSNIKKSPAVLDVSPSLAHQADFLEDLFVAALSLYKRSIPLSHSEAVFNDFLVAPFLKAISCAVGEGENEAMNVGFFPGEEHLTSMAKQLKKQNQQNDGRFCYNADGVIRLQDFYNIEVCVAEVSGVYGNKDMTKINFDHHKGMFAVLSMLKTIADELKYGSIGVFEKVKVFFLHAADDKMKLWSLSYRGGIFHLWREDVLELKPDFKSKAEFLQQAIRFYGNFKCLLGDTLQDLQSLQASHDDNLKKSRYSSASSAATSPLLLSQIVNPSILRLTEKEHSKGMASCGPFDSPMHD